MDHILVTANADSNFSAGAIEIKHFIALKCSLIPLSKHRDTDYEPDIALTDVTVASTVKIRAL